MARRLLRAIVVSGESRPAEAVTSTRVDKCGIQLDWAIFDRPQGLTRLAKA